MLALAHTRPQRTPSPQPPRHRLCRRHHASYPGTQSAKLVGMGFNPFRPSRRSPADLLMVAAALAVVALAVAWAAFGG